MHKHQTPTVSDLLEDFDYYLMLRDTPEVPKSHVDDFGSKLYKDFIETCLDIKCLRKILNMEHGVLKKYYSPVL